jgi:hypothetical protein
MAGFDQRRRAKIDVADVRKNAHGRNQSRAHQTHCDDLEMRPAIGAVYGMVHCSLPSFVNDTLRRPTGRLHYALVNAYWLNRLDDLYFGVGSRRREPFDRQPGKTVPHCKKAALTQDSEL